MGVKNISENYYNSLLIAFTIIAYLRNSKKLNPEYIYTISVLYEMCQY